MRLRIQEYLIESRRKLEHLGLPLAAPLQVMANLCHELKERIDDIVLPITGATELIYAMNQNSTQFRIDLFRETPRFMPLRKHCCIQLFEKADTTPPMSDAGTCEDVYSVDDAVEANDGEDTVDKINTAIFPLILRTDDNDEQTEIYNACIRSLKIEENKNKVYDLDDLQYIKNRYKRRLLDLPFLTVLQITREGSSWIYKVLCCPRTNSPKH